MAKAASHEAEMLAALTRALSCYITEENVRDAFGELLAVLLSVTDSEYGFIGEVLETEGGAPYLRTHAITNIAWSEETSRFYEENAPTGLEFFNLDTLFGAVLVSGEAVIANSPKDDPRAGGIPEGHPPLDAFLGLPFDHRGTMIGMVGIANRVGGYDQTIVERLEPLLGVCAQLIHAHRMDVERTAARAREERLLDVLEQARRLESLGRLAGGIAHDFNNLLTIISGNCELLEEVVEGHSDATKDLAVIAHAADRATTLTRHLLTFARRNDMVVTSADFSEVLDDSLQLLRRLIGSDIELVATVEEIEGHVRLEAAQLEQIIVNLGVNARDALPDGGTIYIDARPIEREGAPLVRLTVRDTGHGIAPDVIQSIFDPFFTTKTQGKGTGLGLAMCYGAVNSADGTLTVASELGEGAEFVVELPLLDATEEPSHQVEDTDAMHGCESILLVEDEEHVRELAVRALRDAGYTVVAASDGLQAETMALGGDHRFDLLLTDVVMPGLNGRDLARKLAPRVPHVLFMSGYLGTANAPQDDQLPLLPKPFRPKQLLKKVREVLGTTRATAWEGQDAARSE